VEVTLLFALLNFLQVGLNNYFWMCDPVFDFGICESGTIQGYSCIDI